MVTRTRLWKITLLLLLGLFVFLYLFVNTVAEFYFAVTNPAAGLHFHYHKDVNRVVIHGVVEEGPADLAGLQRGDQIIAVNGRSINSQWDFIRALLALDLGKLAEIEARRDNLNVKIAFVSERVVNFKLVFLSLLPGMMFGYMLCLIGVFVLLKRIGDKEAHLFYLMLIFWALAMRETFPQGYMLHNILPFWFRDVLLLPAWPLAVGLFLHFHLVFPVENQTFARRRRLFLLLMYAPVLLIVPHLYAYLNHLAWVTSFLRIGWGIWLSLYFTIALAVLAYSMRHAANAYIQKQTEIMFYGTTVSLGVPFVLYFCPRLLLGQSFPLAEVSSVLVVLWPLTLAYTIVKHRFMNIDFIIKRGVAYALVSGFVVAAYFLLVVGVGQLVLFLTGSRSQLVTILATLLIAALFNPVKNRIQNFVERRFYPSKFTYREAFRSFGHELVNVLDLEQLLERLRRFLAETMRIHPVVLFWHDEQQRFVMRNGHDAASADLPQFQGESFVLSRMHRKQQLVDLSPLKVHLQDFLPEEWAAWQDLQTELVMPLLAKGKLQGFVSIGPKMDDEPYFDMDLQLLQSLSDRVNISLENALLTQALREQDRLRKELEVARRIQLSSLPQADPQVPGLEVSGISIPALEVGGDYYDYLNFAGGRFGVVVGDVSGKGTSAALYMSQLRGILKTASQYHKSLKELLAVVNAVTYGNIELHSFITLTCAAFDVPHRELRLVRAGHLPLLYYCAAQNTCRELTPKGIGVGLENGTVFNAELEETEMTFASGDVFLFFTDGITEARTTQNEELDTRFLVDLMTRNGCASAVELRDKIISGVLESAGGDAQRDDMTLVVVRIR